MSLSLVEAREARPIYAASQFDELRDGKDFRTGGESARECNAAATSANT